MKNVYLFWIYDGNLFLGGGYTRNKKDGEIELVWRQSNHPTAVIYWEEEKFTLENARTIAFIVAKTVQRIQPGIRQSARPNPAELARPILKKIGIAVPSSQDNIKRILGNELAKQIAEKGQIEQLTENKPKQLEGK